MGKEVSASASDSEAIYKAYQCFAAGLPFWGYACHPLVRQVREAAERAVFDIERCLVMEQYLNDCGSDRPSLGRIPEDEMQYSDVVLGQIMEAIANDYNRRASGVEGQVRPAPTRLKCVLVRSASTTEPVLWVGQVDAYVVATGAKSEDESVRKAHTQACYANLSDKLCV